jgi:hypothetical protein
VARQRGVFIFAGSVILLSLIQPARADVLTKCVTLMSAEGATTSVDGAITPLLDLDPNKNLAKAFTGVATGVNNSGTTPTMDIKIQTCEQNDSDTCADTPIVFDQCTTSDCYGGDGQRIDVNKESVNVFPYFRAIRALGGTDPDYDVTVKICYQ